MACQYNIIKYYSNDIIAHIIASSKLSYWTRKLSKALECCTKHSFKTSHVLCNYLNYDIINQ